MRNLESLESRSLFSVTALPDIKAGFSDSLTIPARATEVDYSVTIKHSAVASYVDTEVDGSFDTTVKLNGSFHEFTSTFALTPAHLSDVQTDTATLVVKFATPQSAGTLNFTSTASTHYGYDGSSSFSVSDVITNRSVNVVTAPQPVAISLVKPHGHAAHLVTMVDSLA